jgi:putative membrane protein
MSTAAQVLAIVIAVMLAWVFVMESFLYRHPKLYPLFLTKPDDLDAVRMWTVNMGWYNLTTAAALVIGVILAHNGHVQAGEALVTFTAAQHTFMAVVLVVSERRLWFNALLEGIPALALLILMLSS